MNLVQLIRRRWIDLALFTLLVVVGLRWLDRGNSGPKQDSPAPDFTLAVAEQPARSVALRSLRGTPVVIEVLAPWCGACRSMSPRMAELARAPRARPVTFLGIAVDSSADEAAAIKRDWGIPFELAIGDARFSSDYGISVLPTIIVIDANGQVRQVTTGLTRESKLEGWLTELGAPRL